MGFFKSIVLNALLAGIIAGTALTGLQTLKVFPLILSAEVFEDAGSKKVTQTNAEHDHAQSKAHEHGDETEKWAPGDGVARLLFSLLANVLLGVALGLVLAAIFALRRIVDWRQGVLWGLGGFVALNLAPAFGLSPVLPGVPAGELVARQTWWLATVLFTASGIAAVFLSNRLIWRVIGVGLIALPHIVGAPHPSSLESGVPATIAVDFAMASLGTNLIFWAILGILTAMATAYLDRNATPDSIPNAS